MQYAVSPTIEPPPPFPTETDAPTARCADLARAVGYLDLDDDLFAGSLLAAAVNEFADDTGRRGSFGPTTPPVLLLRALSRLSLRSPDARSSSAHVLLCTHDAAPRGAA